MAAPSTCIRLTGTSTCPGFQDQYINPATLQSAWPFFSTVTDVSSFDTAFSAWLASPNGFRAQKYGRELGCSGFATSYALQWAQTFHCGQFTQIAFSDSCYSDAAIRRMTCQKSCLEYAAAEVDVVGNLTVCPGNTLGSSDARQAQLTQDLVQCTTWTTLASNNTQTCVLGENNEPNCGFGTSTAQLCDYCNPAQGGLLPSCCIGVRTDLSSCGFALAATQASSSLPPSTTLTFVPSSSIAASVSALLAAFSSSVRSEISAASAAAARADGGDGLSAGAKAGIAIGSIIGGLLLIALLAVLFLICRRRKRDEDERSPSSAAFFRSRSREHSMSIADTERSYMTEKKGGIRNFLVGASGLGGNKQSQDGVTDEGHGAGSGSRGSPNLGQASGAGPSRNSGLGGAAAAGAAGAGAGFVGAAALSRSNSEKERPLSGETVESGTSGDDGRNLVDSHTDQYTNTTIIPGSDVLAIYAYNPTLPDELKLEPDMIVTIRKIFDDGWAVGAVTRMPDGSKPDASSLREGAFPLICTCNASAEALMTDGATSTRSSQGPNGSVNPRAASSRHGGRSLIDPSERTESFNSAVSRMDDGTSDDTHAGRAMTADDHDRQETVNDDAEQQGQQGWFSGILGSRQS